MTMRDVSCKLLSTTLTTNSIGVQTETKIEIEIPIIKVEDVYANEYYQANQQGFKPSLRLRISALNYNDEEELIYMGKTYSIIRTQEPTADEVVLICERKIKNV
jgi:SPP1 family predicted phage head-tail adaptor